MPTCWILTGAIVAPLLTGLWTLLIRRDALVWRVAVAALGPLGSLGLLGLYAVGDAGPIDPDPVSIAWVPATQLNLQLSANPLGLFFALLVSAFGLLITLYARAYFGRDPNSLYRFYPSLHLFMTSMIGVALADSFILMLMFWELTSISSFFLIGWDYHEPGAVKKAMQAFVVTAAGGLCLMAGLILVGLQSGQWTFSGLIGAAEATQQPSLPLTAGVVLIFAGAAAKSAQWPLHFWLPGAMVAPTPVSAYLHAATMVKAGIYLVGRLWPWLSAITLWPVLVLPIGAITMVYGAYLALRKSDLKQIFAYSTVSQLGLLMCMYALGPHWEVAQILNHALYKGALFILAGGIGHVASRQLPELAGLFYRGRTERTMSVLLLMAAYAMAAGPLTVSFSAKELFFDQIWHHARHSAWFYPLIGAAVATGMFNVAIFLRMAMTLLGRTAARQEGPGHAHHGHESGFWPVFLWLPAALLVAVQCAGGLVPGLFVWLFGWLEPAPQQGPFPMTWQVHAGVPLVMTLCAMGLGVALAVGPLLRRTAGDWHDRLYPAFYELCTRGGGRVFGLFQTGHARFYLALVFLATVGLVAFASIRAGAFGQNLDAEQLRPASSLRSYLVAALVCLTALLMPFVKERASRVLVLGSCGFAVTAVFYLYQAPDLALTQISIEIVSLILFLLVLSLLPKRVESPDVAILPRLVLAAAVGLTLFWLTLTSAATPRPVLPYHTAEGRPFRDLGHFFLRNSDKALDAAHWPQPTGRGVVALAPTGNQAGTRLHSGGGGRNVVNVILVDGRGLDTMGEISVLGLAALGVWTLMRRQRAKPAWPDNPDQDAATGNPGQPAQAMPRRSGP